MYSEIEDGGFRKVSKAMLKVLLGVATKLSELENDKEFITKTVSDLENYYLKSETYSKDEIDNRISLIPRFDVQVVSSLPTTNISETTVYLVSSGDDSDNLYTEYINVNGLWEILGTQKIASVENAVLYTEQSLTDEQKAQARTNISAASAEEVGQLREQIGASSWNDLTDKPFYSEYEEAEIFSKTFTMADVDETEGCIIIPYDFELICGNTYTVVCNGESFLSKCIEINGDLALGNLGITGDDDDTGENYVMAIYTQDAWGMLLFKEIADGTATEDSTWTFSIKGVVETIHKLDKKYIDSDFIFERTVVEETICENRRIIISNGITIIHTGDLGIEKGLEVTIDIDGIEYACVWKEFISGLYAGNMSVMGTGEDTGEPFALVYGISAEANNTMWVYMTEYTSAYANVTVKTQMALYNEIPHEYLPNSLKLSGRIYELSNFEDEDDAYKYFKSGATIRGGSKKFILSASNSIDDTYPNIWADINFDKLYYDQTLFGETYEIPLLLSSQEIPIIKTSELSVGDSIRIKEIGTGGNITWEAFDPSELSGNVDLTGYVKTEDLEQEVLSQLEGAKADIAQQVIDAFNGMPLFGTVDTDNNIKITSMLADGEYTLVYENSDGTTTELGTFIVDGESGADSNNLIASSIGSDGQPYNGGLGYKNDYRLNSSGAEASASGKAVTGFIPVTVGGKLYGANLGWDNTDPTSNYFALYDESFTKLQSINETNMRSFGGTFDINNGGFQIYVQDSYGGVSTSNAKYARISGTGSGANFILSNEAIE